MTKMSDPKAPGGYGCSPNEGGARMVWRVESPDLVPTEHVWVDDFFASSCPFNHIPRSGSASCGNLFHKSETSSDFWSVVWANDAHMHHRRFGV